MRATRVTYSSRTPGIRRERKTVTIMAVLPNWDESATPAGSAQMQAGDGNHPSRRWRGTAPHWPVFSAQREVDMKTMIHLGAAAAFCVTLCVVPGRAQAQGAFCAEDSHGYRNCGFYTLAQCRQALAGMGGACTPNPAAKAPEQPPTRAGKRKHAE